MLLNKRGKIFKIIEVNNSLTEYTSQRSDMLLLMLYKCTLKILFFYIEKSPLKYNADIFRIFY